MILWKGAVYTVSSFVLVQPFVLFEITTERLECPGGVAVIAVRAGIGKKDPLYLYSPSTWRCLSQPRSFLPSQRTFFV